MSAVETHAQSVVRRMLATLADPAGIQGHPPRKLLAACPGACNGTGEVGCGACLGSGLAGVGERSCSSCDGGTKACVRCGGHGEVEPRNLSPAIVCTPCGEHIEVPSRGLAEWLDQHASCEPS